MAIINFGREETFKTPDGNEWKINPLKRKHLKKITNFTKLNNELEKAQETNDSFEANKVIFGVEEDNDDELTLLKLTDEIIDLSIKNKKTGEPFPEEYRREITTALEIVTLIIQVSSGTRQKQATGDDTPLPTKTESDTPGQPTTS